MEMESRLADIEKRVFVMEKDLLVFNSIVSRSNDVIEKLNNSIAKLDSSIDDISLTLVKMQAELTQNTVGVSDLKDTFKKQAEKDSISILGFVKQNIVAIGMFIYIIAEHLGVLN